MSLQPGTRLGNYEVLSDLGRGGMGEVYKARDLKLGREVAIKVLPRAMAADAQRLRRFEQEARAASALNHPNIVTIYEIGEHEGTPYIAMEYVDGKTLREMLSDGPLPNDKLIRYATQMAEGLAKAHEAGIVHRDLKPENIVISDDGYVKILDFGLAKLLPLDGVGSEVATMEKEGTAPGTILGTVSYMSPEQAKGEATDFRSDQFSFGAVLYEMATGERAFGRDTAAETLAAVLTEVPQLEDELGPIVSRCLKKAPEERWARTEELLSALRETRLSAFQASSEPSVAVLPFQDLSPKRDSEYFSDGLTDEVISDLSQIRELRVISRSSAMTLKGTTKNIGDIARELNVEFVLEGSVRKAGNQLRITAQLIDAEKDTPLWSKKYDGTLDDIFDIQEKVSRAIVDALKVQLTPDEDRRIAEHRIEDVRVYECVHRARLEAWRGTAGATARALDLTQRGLEVLGESEPLYAVMGSVHFEAMNISLIAKPPDESHLEEAERCADKVFAMNPESPHAHSLRGAILYKRGDLQASLSSLRRAHELDPNNAEILFYLSAIYMLSGRGDAGLPHARRLMEVDPLSGIGQCWWSWIETHRGRLEASLEPVRRSYELDRDNWLIAYFYLMSLTVNQRREDLYLLVDDTERRAPGTPLAQLSRFLKYAFKGDAARATESITEDLVAGAKWDEHLSWCLADGYALLGQDESAVEWLENASLRRGMIDYPFLAEHDPNLKAIRDSPKLQELMGKIRDRWERFHA